VPTQNIVIKEFCFYQIQYTKKWTFLILKCEKINKLRMVLSNRIRYYYYICLTSMVILGAASYNTTSSVADARSNSTIKSVVIQQQIKRDIKSSNLNIVSAIAVPPAEAGSPSRLSLNTHNSQSNTANQNIRHETYKALLGETVRLECPQPNPTWFFRRSRHQKQNGDSTSSTTNNKNNDNVEDLIVTRHGIINADYKYKIMCHVTLKHQVIIINNIDFDEEGLYTCLYTQSPPPSSLLSNSFTLADGDNENNDQDYNGESRSSNSMPTQYRYVFNVTVYSKRKLNFFSP
jgi:hypothetical protein